MSKKQAFIDTVETLLLQTGAIMGKEAALYFEALKMGGDAEGSKQGFTENGKAILAFMQESKESYNNLFKSKAIAESIGLTSRVVSGGMRKLCSDGYVEKLDGTSPIIYCLTKKGETVDLSAE